VIARLRKIDKWRSQFNPLRGLNVQRAVSLLEQAEGGQYADLMWAYRMIEKREPTLRGLKRLRLSALSKLDWDIKLADSSRAANAQAKALRAAYDKVANLNRALRHLALAEFRGFAHLEKVYEGDNPLAPVIKLEAVEQWHWLRDGLYGEWQYNAAAAQISRGQAIDTRHFIIREVDDPINEIAFFCYLRKNLSQKDWDAFVETYGIPPLFVEMPANVPPGKEGEYQEMAEAVVGDMRGTLPNGAKPHTLGDGARGANPFRDHLDYQDEQLVLAGTSGKLTMLTASTGLDGGGQAGAHSDTFDELAIAEAGEISEIMQEQFDAPLLARLFPGQPVLAYFQLAAEDKADIGQILDHALKATQAGYQIDAAELAEKTGYKLVVRPPSPGPGFGTAGFPVPQTQNRDTGVAEARDQLFRAEALRTLSAAQSAALRPLVVRMVAVAEEEDDAKFDAALEQLRADLPALAAEILKGDATGELAKAWENILGPALLSGAVEAAQARAADAVTRNRSASGLLGWLHSLFRA
jgi:phage gp29-like protein